MPNWVYTTIKTSSKNKALHLPYTELKHFEGFVDKRIGWGEKQTE
jgi:hypothetical protein